MADFEGMVIEMLALMSSTDGVVGLRADGGVMSWADATKLYLPSWRSASLNARGDTAESGDLSEA